MSPLRHRTIRAETDTWQLIRFQFKESSNIPFLSTGVFFFFTGRALHLLQHFLFTWCPHGQAARRAEKPSAPALTQALSTTYPLFWQSLLAQLKDFEVITVCSSLWEEQLIFDSFSLLCYILPSFVLPCIRTQLSQNRLVYARDK